MKPKYIILFLFLILAFPNANAWNVFVKSGSDYQLKYSSLKNISINGVADKLGYGENFFYTYMNYDENVQQDIEVVSIIS